MGLFRRPPEVVIVLRPDGTVDTISGPLDMRVEVKNMRRNRG